MGCIFSTERDEKKVDERRPSVQQQQARQKLQQQQVVNGHQRPQEPLPVGNGGNELKQISRSKTPSPIESDCSSVNNNEAELNKDNTETQFQRQQFDRASVLRHSKKRKKSSASNPNSPAVLVTPHPAANGTPLPAAYTPPAPDTPAPSTLPQNEFSSSSFANNDLQESQSSVVKEIDFEAVANEEDDAPEIQDKQPMDEVQPEVTTVADVGFEKPPVIEFQAEPVKLDEPMSASARVAALLAGPAPKPRAASPKQDSAPPSPPASYEHPEWTSNFTPLFPGISQDILITDTSPLPTPPPTPPPFESYNPPKTPPPSEIPSVIPDPATPCVQKALINGVEKNVVVTSTPLAKQMLFINTNSTNNTISNNKPVKTSIPTARAIPSAIPVAATPSRTVPAAFLTTTPASTITPSRIPKLASGSSINGGHAKLVKTPSGPKVNGTANGIGVRQTPMSSSGGKSSLGPSGPNQTPSSNGRHVLRTRRQVAQELEEQQRNGNRFEKTRENNEENEDCGRLI